MSGVVLLEIMKKLASQLAVKERKKERKKTIKREKERGCFIFCFLTPSYLLIHWALRLLNFGTKQNKVKIIDKCSCSISELLFCWANTGTMPTFWLVEWWDTQMTTKTYRLSYFNPWPTNGRHEYSFWRPLLNDIKKGNSLVYHG